MRITRNVVFETTPQKLVKALLSQELAAKRMALVGVSDYAHSVDGTRAHTEFSVPASTLPSQVRTFVRSDVHGSVEALAEGDGISYHVKVAGVPVQISVAIVLTAGNGGATTATIQADVSVKIPFVGAKVEKMAAGKVDQVLDKDAELVRQTLNEID